MLASVLVFQVAVLACIVVNRLVLRDSPQPPPVPAQWLAIQVGLTLGYVVVLGRGWVATPIDAWPERRDDPAMAPCLTMGTDARAILRAV